MLYSGVRGRSVDCVKVGNFGVCEMRRGEGLVGASDGLAWAMNDTYVDEVHVKEDDCVHAVTLLSDAVIPTIYKNKQSKSVNYQEYLNI
jgi:hypothetical protein